jgi:hypothetical protein
MASSSVNVISHPNSMMSLRVHPIARLNQWINRILTIGITQYSTRDDFEALLSELYQERGYRVIAKRLKRIAECFPRDLLSAELQNSLTSQHSSWFGWGKGGDDVSDRSLYLPPSPSINHQRVGVKKAPQRSWTDRLLEEMGALCMLLQMTENIETLSEDAQVQHQTRLGLNSHRLQDRSGRLLKGQFLSLGQSSTAIFAQRRQLTHWILHLDSGEILMSRTSPKSYNQKDKLQTPAKSEVFWGKAKVFPMPAPRQIMWLELSDDQQGSALSSQLLHHVQWKSCFKEILADWRAHLAIDPFSLRPLFALRGARIAAKNIGSPRQFEELSDVTLNSPLSTGEVNPPKLQAYVIDSEGVSTRIYATSRTLWAMIEASERGPINLIGEWGGKGCREVLWFEQNQENSLIYQTQETQLNSTSSSTQNLNELLDDQPVHLHHHESSDYVVKLCELEKCEYLIEGPIPQTLTELLSEREERESLIDRYRNRAESGVGSELDDQELIHELRRDLATLWLWRRADLPLSSPPLFYNYLELRQASVPALKQAQIKHEQRRVYGWGTDTGKGWGVQDSKDSTNDMPF